MFICKSVSTTQKATYSTMQYNAESSHGKKAGR